MKHRLLLADAGGVDERLPNKSDFIALAGGGVSPDARALGPFSSPSLKSPDGRIGSE
jgi:hypothetical protein